MLASIKKLLRQDWVCVLHHRLREGNFATDFLAKMGAKSVVDLSVIQEAPLEMSSILLLEAMELPFVRH